MGGGGEQMKETARAARRRRIRPAGALLLPALALVALGVPAAPGQAAEPAPSARGAQTYPINPPTPDPLEAEATRRAAYRRCLSLAAPHIRREVRRARRLSGSRRARLRRHIKRHRASLRRRCVRAHGRTPGRVRDLRARAASRRRVVLRFSATGTDGSNPPAARTYVIKQSRRPIRGARAFRRAQTLCARGRCRFAGVTDVGARLTLTVTDLRPRTGYYYALAARDNVTGKLGPRSRNARVRTR